MLHFFYETYTLRIMILHIAVYYISSKSVEKASTQQLVLESVFCSPEINILGYHLLWPFRSVAVSICGRFGLWPFRLWPVRFVAVMTCYLIHKIQDYLTPAPMKQRQSVWVNKYHESTKNCPIVTTHSETIYVYVYCKRCWT